MAITDIGYRIIDGVDALGTQMSDTIFGAPIRLGVTGLARSGKTVFITSLVANLLSGAKLPQFVASAQDRIGLWRLLQSVSAQLMAIRAFLVGDDWLSSVFGGSLLSRLSRRLGEGMVNATLTARVGRAAIDVCRPLPFKIQERSKICDVLHRALTGIFDKTPD